MDDLRKHKNTNAVWYNATFHKYRHERCIFYLVFKLRHDAAPTYQRLEQVVADSNFKYVLEIKDVP